MANTALKPSVADKFGAYPFSMTRSATFIEQTPAT